MSVSSKRLSPSRGGRGHSENQGGEGGHRPRPPKPAPFPSPSGPGGASPTHRPGALVSKGPLGRGGKERPPDVGLPCQARGFCPLSLSTL